AIVSSSSQVTSPVRGSPAASSRARRRRRSTVSRKTSSSSAWREGKCRCRVAEPTPASRAISSRETWAPSRATRAAAAARSRSWLRCQSDRCGAVLGFVMRQSSQFDKTEGHPICWASQNGVAPHIERWRIAVSEFVIVTGATGKQGGAVARALLRGGVPVHALVRDPGSERAAALGSLGAVLVRGDLGDVASLRAALAGARGVFSVQVPDLAAPAGDSEVRHGRNLVEAARAAGVEHVVHTSVSGAGTVDVERFDEQRWGAHMRHYWRGKAAVEELVRGLPRWTILRPATFMENFVRPSFYFADMTSDRLLVGVDPDARLPFVAVEDIGAAAAAAFAEPRRFHGVEL